MPQSSSDVVNSIFFFWGAKGSSSWLIFVGYIVLHICVGNVYIGVNVHVLEGVDV